MANWLLKDAFECSLMGKREVKGIEKERKKKCKI
jgi:hypothetical protein